MNYKEEEELAAFGARPRSSSEFERLERPKKQAKVDK
jgi:hypothetical protein